VQGGEPYPSEADSKSAPPRKPNPNLVPVTHPIPDPITPPEEVAATGRRSPPPEEATACIFLGPTVNLGPIGGTTPAALTAPAANPNQKPIPLPRSAGALPLPSSAGSHPRPSVHVKLDSVNIGGEPAPPSPAGSQPRPGVHGVKTAKSTWQQVKSVKSTWQQDFDLYTSEVELSGVSGLEGYSVNLERFQTTLPLCVAAGLVSQEHADFVLHGLEFGFDLDVDHAMMAGRRVHKNYSSAYQNKAKVTKALAKRVTDGKTLKLGAFSGCSDELPPGAGSVVPQGAVPKKLEPDSVRPFSDHTKTGLNNSVDLSGLGHTLNTYNEIAAALRPGFYMRVEDVDGAFPNLPIAPSTWRYMYVWWYDVDRPLEEQSEPNTLYVHTFADFGTAPLPAIWDRFWKCVKAMASLDGVLTLPMPHFVDDNSIIGPTAEAVDEMADALSVYTSGLGVPFKASKSRRAQLCQLVLGFWWDSVKRTRTLEAHKLGSYLEFFREIGSRKTASLVELQCLIGRLHRAIMTMPPGSNVFLSRVLPLISGLTLPWHKRRLTAGARADILSVARILESNLGRGYFDYSHMSWAPAVYTDAMKDGSVAGWGWCSLSGHYDYGVYGSSQRRRFIDALEGDAVLRAATALGVSWKGLRVPIYIDSKSFQLSLAKGRSTAERMNGIIRQLFELSVSLDCVLVPIWLSSIDNVGADALSRNDLIRFQDWAVLRAPGVSFSRGGIGT
jgi:hypothetical protein